MGHSECVAGFLIFLAIGSCIVGTAVYFMMKKAAPDKLGAPARRLSRQEVDALTLSNVVARPAKDHDQEKYLLRTLFAASLGVQSSREDEDAPAVVLRLPD